jgi:enediyne biosynthesis protein E4
MRAAFAVLFLASPAAAQTPQFVQATDEAGIVHVHAGDEWGHMVGGGVAAFDCSGNGLPDLWLAGGEGPATLWRNGSTPGGPLSFAPVAGSGANLAGASGAWPLDIDGDGIIDLAVLRVGGDVLLRGLGDCTFEDASAKWGFDGKNRWSTAFAATWEAGQHWPTLAIGTYIDREEDAFPWGSCTETWLYRPKPGGGYDAPLSLDPGHCALSMLFTDWARRGTPDLRVSNDREYYKGGQEQLWRMEPGEAPRLYTEDEGWARLRIWGMGIASADITGNGFPDYFLTSMADNRLQVLAEPGEAPRPVYRDQAYPRGATAHRPHTGDSIAPSTAWHAEFGDVNNDGLADLFIAKGNVAKMPDFALEDPNNLLMQRPDGTFEEVSVTAGTASLRTARGGALVDLNADGLLDMVAVNRWEGAEVWRNVTPGAGGWLMLAPRQATGNRDSIGAFVEVRSDTHTEVRELWVGGGHGGGQLGWRHFGLGAAEAAEVRILWPDGPPGAWHRLPANGWWVVPRDGAPEPWTPPG